jgi:hypothetical protein
MLCSLPARMLLVFYMSFLFFYFIPWNLKNMDKASEMEINLKEKYGQINTMDEMSLAITQLMSLTCVIFSLISIYKCGVITVASGRQTPKIWLYPITVFLSIVASMHSHVNYHNHMLSSSHSLVLFAHPMLSVLRGVIFYNILYSPAKVKCASHEAPPADPTQSTLSLLMEFSSKFWFIAYWIVYVFVGSFFYNEMVKYIVEEHIDLEAVMKFVLV